VGWVGFIYARGNFFVNLTIYIYSSQPSEECFPPPGKKIRMDPFAERRDGVFSEEPTWVQVHSAREELAQYKALKVPAKYSQPLLF